MSSTKAAERPRAIVPTAAELDAIWAEKYGPLETMGSVPRSRQRAGYYLPSDVYETIVARQVFDGAMWLDVGGGHSVFPENHLLSKTLAARAGRLVAVDPSDNVHRNPFAHDRVQAMLEDYKTPQTFDLATMRMVVEHVSNPEAFVGALSRLLKPGAAAVVFTVSLWSPVTVLSRVLPFGLHHKIKDVVWGGDEADTFPVSYKMNTRRTLRALFEKAGFTEELFMRRADLSVFGGVRGLRAVEFAAWRTFNRLGLPYPEACLLAVYRKQGGTSR